MITSVVIKIFFKKTFLDIFFPFFKLFFIVAVASCLYCCALTMALGTDYIPGLLELLRSETYLAG